MGGRRPCAVTALIQVSCLLMIGAFYYYYDTIVNDDRTQVIGVNGVEPSKKTIENGTYPYITEVMASVRTDTNKSSTTYQLFYQLATGQHNAIIKESGYSVIDHAGR